MCTPTNIFEQKRINHGNSARLCEERIGTPAQGQAGCDHGGY